METTRKQRRHIRNEPPFRETTWKQENPEWKRGPFNKPFPVSFLQTSTRARENDPVKMNRPEHSQV